MHKYSKDYICLLLLTALTIAILIGYTHTCSYFRLTRTAPFPASFLQKNMSYAFKGEVILKTLV